MEDYKELVQMLHRHIMGDDYFNINSNFASAVVQAADAIEHLVKERDAAINAIPHKCWSCGKGYHTENGFECEETWYKGNNPDCLNWEWRGVQE